jgi:hypothetical protein
LLQLAVAVAVVTMVALETLMVVMADLAAVITMTSTLNFQREPLAQEPLAKEILDLGLSLIQKLAVVVAAQV